MANVPYLAAGEDFGHERMSALWVELDRKMAVMLDGKSPRILGQGLMSSGREFAFLGANPQYATGPRYNHAAFTAAAASVAEYYRDTTRHFIRVEMPTAADFAAAGYANSGSLFAHSLEAHKRTIDVDGKPTQFWLWERGSTVPEKRYRYAVAELVFDDFGNNCTLPATWDKYNFFRIHNLQPNALTVKFAGSDFAIVIPRWGCAAVRRDSVTSGYEAPLKYFWRFKSGDPRFLQFKALAGVGKEVYGTMAANNVTNPAMIFALIQMWEAEGLGDPFGINDVRWIRDPHAVYNLGTYHGKFGDPANGGTIVGDLVHHKGSMRYYRSDVDGPREVAFDGYATLGAKLAAVGLQLTDEGANVAISAPPGAVYTELLAYGTNLLHKRGADASFVPVTSVSVEHYTIDAAAPDQSALGIHAFRQFRVGIGVSESSGFYRTGDPSHPDFVEVKRSATVLALVGPGTPDGPMRIWRDKVSDALTLHNFYGPADPGVILNCTFENRRMVLTIFGPEIHFEMRAPLNGLVQGIKEFLTDPTVTIEGGVMVRKYAIAWPAVGWGTPNDPGFFAPWKTRRYSARQVVDQEASEPLTYGFWRHPDIANEYASDGGNDFDLESVSESYEASEVSALCPAILDGAVDHAEGQNFRTWKITDDLHLATKQFVQFRYISTTPSTPAIGETQWMPRVFMLSELYNTMAAWVNGITRAKPLTFANSKLWIAPNLTPMDFTELRRIDQYARGNSPRPEIPTRTAVLTGIEFRTVHARATFNAGERVGTIMTSADQVGVIYIGASVLLQPPSTRYIAIADVKQFAEANGFLFTYVDVGRPMGVVVNFANPKSAVTDVIQPFGRIEEADFPAIAVFSADQGLQIWKSNQSAGRLKKNAKAGTKYYGGSANARFDPGLQDSVSNHFVAQTIAAGVWAPSTGLVQQYLSAGLISETVAILTPLQTFKHTTEDFAGGDSLDNWRKLISGGIEFLPIGVEGASGPSKVIPIGTGDTRVPAETEEDEFVVIPKIFVDLT